MSNVIPFPKKPTFVDSFDAWWSSLPMDWLQDPLDELKLPRGAGKYITQSLEWEGEIYVTTDSNQLWVYTIGSGRWEKL